MERRRWPTSQYVAADNLPTLVVHRYALLGVVCNGRRLSGFLDQSVTLMVVASNQAVGSSNLSGRATPSAIDDVVILGGSPAGSRLTRGDCSAIPLILVHCPSEGE